MGFQDCPDTPLVLISYTISWYRAADDELIYREVRKEIENIETFVENIGTVYPYKFYTCRGEWQDPFQGMRWWERAFCRR